jgi:hypothetical protein
MGEKRTGQDTDSREDRRVGRRVRPSALRVYSLARAAAADAAPSASWAVFCATSDDDDDNDVEANRRGALARRRARNIADCIPLFCTFSFESRGLIS